MNEQAFDGLTRRAAAAVSRRSSLAALGGAALAAGLVAPTPYDVRAAKGKKKKKKCQKQLGQCQEATKEFCDSLPIVKIVAQSVTAEGTCEAFLSECCSHFSSCNAREGVECLLERVLETVAD
jgi:hypothetical protein